MRYSKPIYVNSIFIKYLLLAQLYVSIVTTVCDSATISTVGLRVCCVIPYATATIFAAFFGLVLPVNYVLIARYQLLFACL